MHAARRERLVSSSGKTMTPGMAGADLSPAGWLSTAQRLQNATLALNAVAALGLGARAPTAEQLLQPAAHPAPVVALLWEVCEHAMLAPLRPHERPELAELLFPDEGLDDLAALLP